VDITSDLLSHHLKVLREADLIVGTKRGRWVDYTILTGSPNPLLAKFHDRKDGPYRGHR